MSQIDSTRPEGVKVTTYLMVTFLILELLSTLFSLASMIKVLGSFQFTLFMGLGTSLIAIACGALFVYFYWRGQNVARWAVMIDAVWVLLSAVWMIFNAFARVRFVGFFAMIFYITAGLQILKCFLAVYLLWYLNQPEAKAWFLGRTSSRGPLSPAAGYTTPYTAHAPATTPVEPTQPPPPPGFTV